MKQISSYLKSGPNLKTIIWHSLKYLNNRLKSPWRFRWHLNNRKCCMKKPVQSSDRNSGYVAPRCGWQVTVYEAEQFLKRRELPSINRSLPKLHFPRPRWQWLPHSEAAERSGADRARSMSVQREMSAPMIMPIILFSRLRSSIHKPSLKKI